MKRVETRRRSSFALLLTLACWTCALGVMPAEAQDVVEIDDDIACPDCLVESGPSITLRVPDDSVWFPGMSGLRVARDSEENYIAAPVEGDALIAVFGPDGRYRSSYGRLGGGPGEFATNMPLLVEIGDGDVVYVISPINLHTLAPRAEASLDKVRMPVGVMGDAVALRSGIAVEAPVRTEAGMSPVQLLRPDGTVIRSIGGDEAPVQGIRRALGRSSDRVDLWSASINRFRITRYAPDGTAKSVIQRNSQLFRPRSSSGAGAPFLAPARTAVTGIVEDGDGLLWITVSRPPPSFVPLRGLSEARSGGEVMVDLSTADPNRFMHTTVEVLDPVAGTVIARRDFDEHVRFVRTRDDDVLVYSLRSTELGGFECVVTPLALQGG